MNRKKYEHKGIVSSYNNMTLQNPEVMILLRHSESILDRRILDIGCGRGRTTAILKNLSKDYVGLDYSSGMIESCRKRFEDVRLVHGDVRDMNEFEDSGYDFIIFSFNGLDSISHEDRLKGLREINRVLRKDGMFVFSSHNRNYRHAISRPKMIFSMTPCMQVGNIWKFVRSACNYLRNRRLQRFEREYAIINDVAHDYAMLTYYIDRASQIRQLEEMGFETIEMYDTAGGLLLPDSDDSDSPWIYYVTTKMGSNLIY